MAARSRARVDEARPKPRSDAYVGLLGLSLVALTAAMLFAFLNWNQISGNPPAVQMAPVGGGARPPAGGGGPAVNPPGQPPGIGQPGQPPGQPGQPGQPPVQPGQPPAPPGGNPQPPQPPQKK